ncbi:MAG: class I SAM-dependent methyltransferase [Acidimicrobiales bacterium]|jgi:SAM-dependent methyltransferase
MTQVPGNFDEVGREFLGYFTEMGGLNPDQRILDIGCGPGRMAIPLTGFMNSSGRYDGIDDWPEAISWCSDNVSAKFGNFHFHTIETNAPAPFADSAFDMTILCAISRITKDQFLKYMSEAGRVLRTGGTYVGTCFVLGDSAPADSPELPAEHPISFYEDDLRSVFSAADMSLDAIHRGRWNGYLAGLSYQDLLIAHKVS